MTQNKESVQLLIDTMASQVVDRCATQKGMSHTDALKEFMKTKTYRLLYDAESFLYLESLEYVCDMLDAEAEGDIGRWLEV